MDFRGLNIATALAALRHELRLRQENVGRDQLPLYIIAGTGEGALAWAVTDTLQAQDVSSVRDALLGVIIVPPQDAGSG